MAFSQPDVRPLPGTWWVPRYRVEQDFTVCYVDAKGISRELTIPAGFTHDGSTEWVLWVVVFAVSVLAEFFGFGWFAIGLFAASLLFGIRSDGPHRAAATVHDYLYANRFGTWTEADYAFWRLMRDAGMPGWRATPRWAFLRVVGYLWWIT